MSGPRALHAAVWELYLRVVRLEAYRRRTPQTDFGVLKDKLEEIADSLGRAEMEIESAFAYIAKHVEEPVVSNAEICMLERRDGELLKGSDVMHGRPPMLQCVMAQCQGAIEFDHQAAELWIRECICTLGDKEWRTLGLWVVQRPTPDTVELAPIEVVRVMLTDTSSKWVEYQQKAAGLLAEQARRGTSS